MSGVEGGDRGAGYFLFFDGAQQRLSKDGTRSEGRDQMRAVGRLKTFIGFDESQTDGGIVKGCEASRGDRIKRTDFQQTLAEVAQVRGSSVNDGLQRGFARCMSRLSSITAWRVSMRARIAQNHAQIADFIA